MEINKISLNSVNKDLAAQDKTYKLECEGDNCYLVEVDTDDEESSIVLEEAKDEKEPQETSATKSEDNEKTVVDLNKDNFEDEVRNQKGTTYVVVCGDLCSRCKAFDPILEQVAQNLGDKANFTSLILPYEEGSKSEEYKLYKALKKDMNYYKGGEYPIIIKCVDGVAKEICDLGAISRIYRKADKMTQWFEERIEGEIEPKVKAEDVDELDAASKDDEETIDETDIETKEEVADEEDFVQKTDLKEEEEVSEEKKDNKYIETALRLDSKADDSAAKEYAIYQVKSVKSIIELKNLLFKLTVIDVETQLEIMDEINSIKFDDDLEEAKSRVLLRLV